MFPKVGEHWSLNPKLICYNHRMTLRRFKISGVTITRLCKGREDVELFECSQLPGILFYAKILMNRMED
jgi:hypothetical protein